MDLTYIYNTLFHGYIPSLENILHGLNLLWTVDLHLNLSRR